MEIIATGKMEKVDYYRAFKNAIGAKYFIFLTIMGLVFSFLLSNLVWFLVMDELAPLWLVLGGALFCICSALFSIYQNYRKLTRKQADLSLVERKYTFSDEGFRQEDKRSYFNWKWRHVKYFHETKDDLFVVADANLSALVPKRLFESQDEVATVVQFMKDRGIKQK